MGRQPLGDAAGDRHAPEISFGREDDLVAGDRWEPEVAEGRRGHVNTRIRQKEGNCGQQRTEAHGRLARRVSATTENGGCGMLREIDRAGYCRLPYLRTAACSQPTKSTTVTALPHRGSFGQSPATLITRITAVR